MAGYSIFISKSVRKSLLHIPLPWSERIVKAIDLLEKDPYLGEKMKGQLADCYKIRVWPYRVIYKLDKANKAIIIIEVGHRGSISYD